MLTTGFLNDMFEIKKRKAKGEKSNMQFKSQTIRAIAPEMDPLRIGMGWTLEDLDKPQIMIESTYGQSHPGSAHLNWFVEEAASGIKENGGKEDIPYKGENHQSAAVNREIILCEICLHKRA